MQDPFFGAFCWLNVFYIELFWFNSILCPWLIWFYDSSFKTGLHRKKSVEILSIFTFILMKVYISFAILFTSKKSVIYELKSTF